MHKMRNIQIIEDLARMQGVEPDTQSVIEIYKQAAIAYIDGLIGLDKSGGILAPVGKAINRGISRTVIKTLPYAAVAGGAYYLGKRHGEKDHILGD